jgi:ribosomal protein S18 acetylase RimI-like enzyme
MDAVAIDRARIDDADTLAELWVDLAAGQRAYGSHLRAEANRTRIREAILRGIVAGRVLVARATRVVGFVMVTVESGGYDQDLDRGLVQNIYVVPEYRNRGVGGDLLSAAESLLRDRGVDAVALEVMAGNEDARRFYRQQGYRPHRVELEKPVESDTHSKGGE